MFVLPHKENKRALDILRPVRTCIVPECCCPPNRSSRRHARGQRGENSGSAEPRAGGPHAASPHAGTPERPDIDLLDLGFGEGPQGAGSRSQLQRWTAAKGVCLNRGLISEST